MNPQDPEQLDPQIEALLDQALAPEGAPPQLSQDIVAAVEKELAVVDGMLDEALASEAAPAGLKQRVFAAVQKHIPAGDLSVIARIGRRFPVTRQIAAIIVIAASTGLAVMAAEISRDVYRLVETWPQLQKDIDALAEITKIEQKDAFYIELQEVRMAVGYVESDALLGDFDALFDEFEDL